MADHSGMREILSSRHPRYIDAAPDARIRDRFKIHLPEAAMRPGNGRC